MKALQAEAEVAPNPERKPSWLRAKAPSGPNHHRLKALVKQLDLHTVCEEAHCPNIGECWGAGTLTFMILGDICTRNCGFCAVTFGRPPTFDPHEPERVAKAVGALGLAHVVVTSVARDDLPDGGAATFAQTIRKIREHDPKVGIEVLIPDFRGSRQALATVTEARPDILNHNIETVARLQKLVRPSARYERSLSVLQTAKETAEGILTKSGIMLGLGEAWEEIMQTMADLRGVDCDILTIGQYLRPSTQHLPLVKHYAPGEFAELRRIGGEMGFRHVEAGPLVRSSYHAERQLRAKPALPRPAQAADAGEGRSGVDIAQPV
ncbi:MAG: lipoyl synthase [Acidobacteria bacterium]|nr:lipoyl synthase [Acidobacteriota bacterium]